jgi:hypothetical protein
MLEKYNHLKILIKKVTKDRDETRRFLNKIVE